VSIVADGHLHLYPCYRLERALYCLAENLSGLAAAAHKATSSVKVAFLAERWDCRVFASLRDGSLRVDGWQTSPARDGGNVLVMQSDRGDSFYLAAGRQIVALERLEVLALMTDAEIKDGLSVEKAIEAVRTAGGAPVLNWAPGKWFFGRGRAVRGLLQRAEPGSLLLCDTSLRFAPWPEPDLMRLAARRGFAILAGSDPLPFPGQEKHAGAYGFVCDAPFDDASPVASLRRMLNESRGLIRRAGRRRPVLGALCDIGRACLKRGGVTSA
jgi:hypothetical protein